MTVISKLSDRDNLIFEAIKIILVNAGNISAKELQWQLFQAGIMIKGPLLKQALSVMKTNGELSHTPIQKEESQA
jgi:predicted nuclease of predicted toxin-antitoxin system